jgi:hypothetical protein
MRFAFDHARTCDKKQRRGSADADFADTEASRWIHDALRERLGPLRPNASGIRLAALANPGVWHISVCGFRFVFNLEIDAAVGKPHLGQRFELIQFGHDSASMSPGFAKRRVEAHGHAAKWLLPRKLSANYNCSETTQERADAEAAP